MLELPDDVARHRLVQRAAADRSDDRDPDVIERWMRRYAAQPPDLVTAAILKALAT